MRTALFIIAALSATACARNSPDGGSSTAGNMVDVCIRYGGGEASCKRKYGGGTTQASSSNSAPIGNTSGGARLASAAEQAAANRGTVGNCYGGVADAMDIALGTSMATWNQYGIGPDHAYQFSDWANANPNDLNSVFGLRRANVSADAAPVGSLFVYEPSHCGMSAVSGHIEIKTGEGRACSDHCRAFSCEPSYVYVPTR